MISNEAESAEIRLPYPGLRPFRRDETDIFFGRETHVDHLLERLSNARFLSVVGSSGCGKSSLIRAGLIPSLEGGFVPSIGPFWFIAEMRPGSHPVRRLAMAVYNAINSSEYTPETAPGEFGFFHAMLRRGPLGLIKALQDTPLPRRGNLLIYIDQFEEIFRYRKEGNVDEAEAFIALLIESSRQQELPIYIMLSMRSEFFGNCDLFCGLPEKINECQYLVPRLTREQSHEAIVGPARVFGGDVDTELTANILNEMGSEPDQLPLMQHFMMRMWLNRLNNGSKKNVASSMINCTDATAVGGFSKALSIHADEAFNSLTEEGRKIAEVMFRCLSDRNIEKVDIRRPVKLQTIADVAKAPIEQVKLVIEVFRHSDRSFLTPAYPEPLFPETVIDISHESLIRQWETMRQWVTVEARAAEIYRSLEKSAIKWKKQRASLWANPELQNALKWKKEQNPNECWARRYGGDFIAAMEFLEASKKSHWRKKGLYAVAVLLIAVLCIMLPMLCQVISLNSKLKKAVKAAAEYNATIEGNKKSLEIATDSIAVKNIRLEATTRELTENNARLTELTNEMSAKNGELTAKSVSLANAVSRADRERTAKDSLIRIESLVQRAPALCSNVDGLLERGEKRLAGLLAWTGYALYSELTGDQIDQRIYDALYTAYNALNPSEKEPTVLDYHNNVISFSFADRMPGLFASGYDNGDIVLWNLHGDSHGMRRLSLPPELTHSNIQCIALSPHGRFIGAGYFDGRVFIDRAAPDSSAPVIFNVKHLKAVTAMAFDSSDSLVASAGIDGNILIWKKMNYFTSSQVPFIIQKTGKKIYTLAFHPSGSLIACGCDDGTIQLWQLNFQTARLTDAKTEHKEKINTIAFSPDGTMLASGGEDKILRIWNISETHTMRPVSVRSEHNGDITSVAFNRTGQYVASASHDNSVILWKVQARGRDYGIEKVLLLQHGAPVMNMAFDPQHDIIASDSGTGKINLWHFNPGYFADRIRSELGSYFLKSEWDSLVQIDDRTISGIDKEEYRKKNYSRNNTTDSCLQSEYGLLKHRFEANTSTEPRDGF